MAFYQEFNQLLGNLRLKYSRKQKTFDLLAYRYGLLDQGLLDRPTASSSNSPPVVDVACPLSPAKTLQAIGELPTVSLTRERVRQIINNGQNILPINFVSRTRNLLAELFEHNQPRLHPQAEINLAPSFSAPSSASSKHYQWVNFQEILTLPYFADLPDPLTLNHWLSDLGYGRWKHQGVLYFYSPGCSLSDVQQEICQFNKRTRHQKSLAYRSRLVGSAIKLPLKEKTRYWELKKRSARSLTELYNEALQRAIAEPQFLLPLSHFPLKPSDIQVGLRLSRSLMSQLKVVAEQEKMGITIFIRQALLSYLAQQLPASSKL